MIQYVDAVRLNCDWSSAAGLERSTEPLPANTDIQFMCMAAVHYRVAFDLLQGSAVACISGPPRTDGVVLGEEEAPGE